MSTKGICVATIVNSLWIMFTLMYQTNVSYMLNIIILVYSHLDKKGKINNLWCLSTIQLSGISTIQLSGSGGWWSRRCCFSSDFIQHKGPIGGRDFRRVFGMTYIYCQVSIITTTCIILCFLYLLVTDTMLVNIEVIFCLCLWSYLTW